MSAPVRLGVVGVGTLAMRVLEHLTLPDVADAVQVSALFDPADGRAAAAAERFGVARTHRSLDELLGDAGVEGVRG